jgi:hypothetical protein
VVRIKRRSEYGKQQVKVVKLIAMRRRNVIRERQAASQQWSTRKSQQRVSLCKSKRRERREVLKKNSIKVKSEENIEERHHFIREQPEGPNEKRNEMFKAL